ncbi:MAG: cupin domain-containing protein [Acidobacteria bacterium]|nr:MAG: cupin domain-containing protein [Acidobacteriota bacterium]
MHKTLLFLLLLMLANLSAQDRTVDPTWLHRFVPRLSEAKADLSSPTCHYKPIFGAGDADNRILRSVSHFGEVTLESQGNCQSVLHDHEEEIYFVLEGTGVLQYGDETHLLRANDFTYLTPGVKHGLTNSSARPLRVLVMAFKIPPRVALNAPPPPVKVVNLDDVKEEPVQGHPTSVLYKLLAGPRNGKRDAIDSAYVITSFFLMDFAPGGTNFPHHHETAEEIYLVVDGEGEMVAGSGIDGLEGRFPAKAGDAYYFRPNCTVGFYNQDKPGAKAHILAVRSKIPLSNEED